MIVASGENPAKNVYTIDAWVAPEGALHGLRIDALAGEGRTLPGRATNQNFVLSTVEVLAAPAGRPEELAPVDLSAAVATHSQTGFSIEGVLDQDPRDGVGGTRARRRSLGAPALRARHRFPGRDRAAGRAALRVAPRGAQLRASSASP